MMVAAGIAIIIEQKASIAGAVERMPGRDSVGGCDGCRCYSCTALMEILDQVIPLMQLQLQFNACWD